jgi:hypothetical protein
MQSTIPKSGSGIRAMESWFWSIARIPIAFTAQGTTPSRVFDSRSDVTYEFIHDQRDQTMAPWHQQFVQVKHLWQWTFPIYSWDFVFMYASSASPFAPVSYWPGYRACRIRLLDAMRSFAELWS